MSDLIYKLTDGTEAVFKSGTTLPEVDEKLAKEGLERDKSARPMAERGDVGKALAKANLPIVQGASAVLGLPGEFEKSSSTMVNELARLFGVTPSQANAFNLTGQIKSLLGSPNLDIGVNAPTSAELVKTAGNLNIPMERAESYPGKVAQTAVRNIISAPVRSAVAPSTISALGEETLAIPFAGTPLEPVARTFGGVAAPLVTAPGMFRSPLENMYAESTKNMTPAQIAAASKLQKESFQQNMPITSFEAMQQASGGRTNLPAIQRQIEGSLNTAPLMSDFMATRGQQTQKTLESTFPTTTRPQLGSEVQKAVVAEQNRLNKQIVAEAGPAIEAVKSKKIPMSWMTNLENESAVLAEAGKAVDNIPAYKDLLKGYPDNSIARIEAMRQYLSDKYDNLASAAMGKTGEVKVTGEMRAYQRAKESLLTKADNQVPAYADARLQYNEARNRIKEPIRQTPIEELAKTNETAKQFAELFATKASAINLTPQKVTTTIKALAKEDPNLPKEFLNQYMRSSLEGVQKAATTQAGTVGSRFADTIAKNTTQRENLKAAFEQVYGNKGKSAVNGLNKMLDILEAQGRRLPSGSPTAEKGMMAEKSISTAAQVLKTPIASAGNLYQSIFYGKDYENIAKAITSPNGVELLEQLAKAGKDNKKIGIGFVEMQKLINATSEQETE